MSLVHARWAATRESGPVHSHSIREDTSAAPTPSRIARCSPMTSPKLSVQIQPQKLVKVAPMAACTSYITDFASAWSVIAVCLSIAGQGPATAVSRGLVGFRGRAAVSVAGCGDGIALGVGLGHGVL